MWFLILGKLNRSTTTCVLLLLSLRVQVQQEVVCRRKEALEFYMNEASGKRFVELGLSASCVVWRHQPWWR